jgi:hypothetical protein
MSKQITKGQFPSQSASDGEKSSSPYGLEIAKAIEAEWFKRDSGSVRYYANRDQFHRLRLYARGEQSIQKYKDELSINGDLSYLNLDWKPVPIIPKFVDIVVNGISERMYDIKAYSQDQASIDTRTSYVDSIVRDMKNKSLFDELENSFSINMYNNDKETLPETQEELELHMQLDYKQSIEIAEEEAINNVFDYNKYDLLKKRLDYDLAVIGIGAVKNSFNTSEGIKIDYVDPADLVYSYTESPYFDDIYYVGEVKRVSLIDLKKQYPELTSEDIEEIEGSSNSSMLYNKSYSSSDSPDNNYVYILYFEYKTFNNQVYKIKETSTGSQKSIKKI